VPYGSTFGFYHLITLDDNGNAEGYVDIDDIVMNTAEPEFGQILGWDLGHYTIKFFASNECSNATCEQKCSVVVFSSIHKKHPTCYVPTECNPDWHLWDPNVVCLGEGQFEIEWWVQVTDYNPNPTNIESVTISINGNVVIPDSYDPATLRYSGVFTVDRCDLEDIYELVATINACDTTIINESAYRPRCIDKKNAFIMEISGMSDYESIHETVAIARNNRGAILGVRRGTYISRAIGLAAYNGTYIFPIECMPHFNDWSGRYEWDLDLTTRFLEISGSIIREFDYITTAPIGDTQYTFHRYFATYTEDLAINCFDSCGPLMDKTKTIRGFIQIESYPPQIISVDCPSTHNACAGWSTGLHHGWGNPKLVGDTSTDFSCSGRDSDPKPWIEYLGCQDDARYFNGTNDYPTIETLKSYIDLHKPGSIFEHKDDMITVVLP
jgi:hypothetical protein